MLKVTAAYTSYIAQFMRRNFEIGSKSYAEQSNLLFRDAFAWADFWKTALSPFGWEVCEVVANIKEMQFRWAKERGYKCDSRNWQYEIALQQIREFEPEVLFVDGYSLFTVEEIDQIRELCPSIRAIVCWCGAPYSDTSVFLPYDLVLSCVPEIVSKLRADGCKSEYLNHAFSYEVLTRIEDVKEKSIPLSFVGQIVPGRQQHSKREKLLTAVAHSDVPIEIYTPSYRWSPQEKIKFEVKKVAASAYSKFIEVGFERRGMEKTPFIQKFVKWREETNFCEDVALSSCFNPPVFGVEMFKKIRQSKVVLNCHIDISKRSASNMRLFEVTGTGSCLLTDRKKNLNTLFEPDYEVVTYSSEEECIEKARWLLDHPREREEIARAGQRKTLKDHTFENRAIQFISIIDQCIKEC